jgi:hypothetical protein
MAEIGPIPFITLDDDSEGGKGFKINQEAADYLRNIKGNVAVVVVAGLYRTGKSFLLNQLTGNTEEKGGGFNVGSTVNACTKGIWLWGAPKHLEEKGLDILFMDTEGLGSTSRSSNQDTKIFSLALLLSSYFVYNSRGVIDGNAIDDLSLVVNLTKMIHVKSQEDDSTDSLHEYFPNFLWVVRDFTLQLEEKGKKISSRQYLENALTQQGGFSEAAAKKNQIRMMISNFFRERDCVTMVRPMVDEDKLRDLNSTPFEELRPEFQKQISQLKLKLNTTMKPKSLNGKILNGPLLLHLAEAYVSAFNAGGVPTISTAWDRVVSTQCEDALRAAVDIYKNAVGVSRIQLQQLNQIYTNTDGCLTLSALGS